jgi:hypothetical protein
MDSEIENKYLFIGGTGRSGTNITRKIFAEHPSVASFPFEYRFIIDPDGVVDFYQSMSNAWSPYMADVKIKRLQSFLEKLGAKNAKKKNYKDWELGEWFPKYQKNINTLIGELKTFDYNGFWPGAIGDASSYEIAFSEYKSKEVLAEITGRFLKNNIDEFIAVNGKNFFVEDNTWNILFAKELFELMPESKLVHLVRDPRDVIASFMSQRWCPNDFNEALKMYKSIINRWFTVEDSLPKDFYKVIKLEELVVNSEEIIKEMCYFSGIPFNAELLNIELNKSNSGRWKKAFTKENEKVIETELSSVFEKLNYKL